MTVRDIMTADPACCAPETSLYEVAQMMAECDCGEIPVCDPQGAPVGVVTDRDIVCRLVAKGQNPAELSARDCMSTPVVTATPEMSLEDCARVMEAHQVRRLPVVDERGACCGIVTQADLATKAPGDATLEVVGRVSAPTDFASSVRSR
jgi:CBS domain-containing protein